MASSKTIEIPKAQRPWLRANRSVPAIVTFDGGKVRIQGAPCEYRMQEITPGRFKLIRVTEAAVFALGEFDRHSIFQPISEAARCDLGLIRAAKFDCSFPAPIAYQLKDGTYSHPGECFKKHIDTVSGPEKWELNPETNTWVQVPFSALLVEKTLHSVKTEDRCLVCKEAFE